MNPTRITRISAVIGLSGLLVAAGSVAALADRGHTRRLPRPAARASAAVVVSSLNRPVNASDVLDAGFTAKLNAFAERAGHPAVDWNNARQVVAGVWVAAAGNDLCIHVGTDHDGAAGCGSADELVDGAGPFITGQDAQSDPYTIGLVPDGVDGVALHLTDGTSTMAPVVNNVYKAAADAPADRLSYQAPAGPVSERLPAARLH